MAATPIEGAAIVRGKGRVRQAGSEAWTDTATGAVLGPGIRVESAEDEPLEMTMPDGVEITLEPGTQAQYLEPSRLPTEKNTFARGYVLTLREGELHVRVPSEPRGAHAFLVTTKAGTLTAWRGSVHIAAKGDTTAVAIYEGALVVGSNGIGFPVYDGAGVVMRKGVNPERGKVIPPAPSWITSPRALGIAPAGAKVPLELAWAAPTGGESYRIEVATDPAMMRVVERRSAAATTASFGATGARYFARVRAVSADGIVGEWSAPLPLRVIRPELPRGGFVAKDGAVVLPAGGEVTLKDAAGLQAAIEPPGIFNPAALAYAPAPRTLRLGEVGARAFWLRDPTSGGTSRVVLTRRTLGASITMTPASPKWPSDPIDIRVSVQDPSGRIDVGTEAVTLEASINGVPIAVAWQRSGSTWTGRLEPQVPPGPWVARVAVKDGGGTEIGRQAVDIAGPALPAKGVRMAETTEIRVFH